MTPEIITKISLLSSCYTKMTGIHLRHTGICNPREQAWFEWIKAGFTVQDLEMVIFWIKSEIRAGRRRQESLLFRNLIQDAWKFEEDVQMARAAQRKPHNPSQEAKASIVASLPTVRQGAPVEAITAKRADEVAAGWIAKMREAVG